MARLGSQANAGYVPTPPRVVRQVAEWIKSEYPVRAIDPCAGTGAALRDLAERAGDESGPWETYGIELQAERAEAARSVLDRVEHGSHDAVEITPGSFSLLYLNPPYDIDDEHGRLERRFLMQHTPQLATGGVLVLIIPRGQVRRLADYLAANYRNIETRHFPKPERDAYDQVVILAQKRKHEDPTAQFPDLYEVCYETYQSLPTLDDGERWTYELPALPTSRPRIRRPVVDWAAVAASIDERDIFDDVRAVQAIHPDSQYRARPLVPMQDGHLAQLAAAGLLDNMQIETDDGSVLVKGTTRKYETVTEDTPEQRVVAERLRVEVTTLNLDSGELHKLDGEEYVNLLTGARDQLLGQVAESYPAMFEDDGAALPDLHRTPLGKQAEAIRATAYSLRHQRATTIIGEMGVGKSYIAAAASYVAGMPWTLIVCPPHLTKKWRREIEQTIPGATAVILKTMADVDKLANEPEYQGLDGPLFAVLSREKAKLGYRRRAAAVRRLHGKAHVLACPDCYQPIRDGKGMLLVGPDWLERARRKCTATVDGKECGAALWTPQTDEAPEHFARTLWRPVKSNPKRYPLADYIAKRHRGMFDLLILDEVHEYKASGSAQGLAAATLSNVIPRTLALTGTYAGGYASTLFHLLYRFSPHIRERYGVKEEQRWVQEYGFIETITKNTEYEEEVGHYTRMRTRSSTRKRERPGIMPQALHHILGHSVFLKLSHISDDLPTYREFARRIDLDDEQGPAYGKLARELHKAVAQALASGSQRLLGAYLQALLSYPDACTSEEIVRDPADDAVIARAPALAADVIRPKEADLQRLFERERKRGRRVLVFATHTETRDITPRLVEVLSEVGATPAVLKSQTVAPDKREAWIDDRVADGCDALILHPRLVQTGLDLLDFPTIVWYEPDYSVYTIRQASRRSWRIGQDQPVEVHHFVYAETLQASALSLVGGKLAASKAIDGDVDESPLDAQADNGDSMTMELARSLLASIEGEADAGGDGDDAIPYFELADDTDEADEPGPDPEPDKPTNGARVGEALADIMRLPVVERDYSQPSLFGFGDGTAEPGPVEQAALSLDLGGVAAG